MKKHLLFLFIICTVFSFCVACGYDVPETPDISEEISQVQSRETSSSKYDEKTSFTMEDAIAYFSFERTTEHYTDFTNASETAMIPFREFERWLDGTSDIVCNFGEWTPSIYELFDTELFLKPFTETDFYTIRINGRSMNILNDYISCMKPVGNYWNQKEGRIYYQLDFSLEGSRVGLLVCHLSEHNENYNATLGAISDYLNATEQEFLPENITTVTIYNQITGEYNDIEIYNYETSRNGIKYIDFIYNRYIFKIEFFELDKSVKVDDILNNIVIMDLLEEYNKICET